MDTKEFIEKEKNRVLNLHSTKHKNGFHSKHDLAGWFISQLKKQEFKCFYCETSIFDIIKLIEQQKLKTRKIRHGCRGPILEIDKMINGLGYSPSNCVLSCYYCNNDKSYTLDSEQYKYFFGPSRKKFFEYLLNETGTFNSSLL